MERDEAENAFWIERRDKFLAGVSDRIRSMSLGSLVLIWSLFTGEHTHVLDLSKATKISLLAIALSTVIVLALDLLEFSSGYQASRQILGETKRMKKFPHKTVREKTLFVKQLLSAANLLMLIMVLGYLLAGSIVHAQGAGGMTDYYGRWCNGNTNTGTVTVLVIDNAHGYDSVTLDDSACTTPVLGTNSITFDCNGDAYKASRDQAVLDVIFNGDSQDKETFYDCKK